MDRREDRRGYMGEWGVSDIPATDRWGCLHLHEASGTSLEHVVSLSNNLWQYRTWYIAALSHEDLACAKHVKPSWAKGGLKVSFANERASGYIPKTSRRSDSPSSCYFGNDRRVDGRATYVRHEFQLNHQARPLSPDSRVGYLLQQGFQLFFND